MKTVIKRNLPLNVQYTCIDKKYIPLIDGCGTCCDNCGKLIANIATVKSVNGVYYIGFDCLETFLINNSLLDAASVEDYQKIKKQLPTLIKHSKEINEAIKGATGKVVKLIFDVTDFKHWIKYGKSSYLTFYYGFESGKRYNSNLKLKNDVCINTLIETIKQITKKEIELI